MAVQHGWDVAHGSGSTDEQVPVGDVTAAIAEIVGHLHKGVEEIVNVEELKTHIHRELFGERFPTAIPIAEWKDQHKKAVMRRSVEVMHHHGQSDQEILQMLEDKFFLTEQQAQEFMANEDCCAKEDKESCQ